MADRPGWDDTRLGDERTALVGMVEHQRSQILGLLDGLDEQQARARLVASRTTVLGLVQHGAFVERVWFAHRLGGRTRLELGLPEAVEDSFVLAPRATVASVRADYEAACAQSRVVLDGIDDLDDTREWHAGTVSVRFVLVHLIQELARHAGHGDILREQLLTAR